MTERAFDPEFTEMIGLLPTVIDWGPATEMAEMRKTMAVIGIRVEPRPDVIREDREIPGRAGDPAVRVRVYRPAADVTTPLAGLVEIHGGGFIVGEIEMMDAFCDRVAADLSAMVVSVDYRLAPENPFPAAVEDC